MTGHHPVQLCHKRIDVSNGFCKYGGEPSNSIQKIPVQSLSRPRRSGGRKSSGMCLYATGKIPAIPPPNKITHRPFSSAFKPYIAPITAASICGHAVVAGVTYGRSHNT